MNNSIVTLYENVPEDLPLSFISVHQIREELGPKRIVINPTSRTMVIDGEIVCKLLGYYESDDGYSSGLVYTRIYRADTEHTKHLEHAKSLR